jgi:hypothetical protein
MPKSGTFQPAGFSVRRPVAYRAGVPRLASVGFQRRSLVGYAEGQPADLPEGWAMTVDADDAEGLRATISKQEGLASPVGAMAVTQRHDEPARFATATADGPAGCQGMEGR